MVLTDFGGGSFEAANALAVQSDGKIVAAGFSTTTPRPDFGLAGTIRRAILTVGLEFTARFSPTSKGPGASMSLLPWPSSRTGRSWRPGSPT
jgi:hypothetical protein